MSTESINEELELTSEEQVIDDAAEQIALRVFLMIVEKNKSTTPKK